MLEVLKEKVYRANMALRDSNLITLTWGNASGIDRESMLVVIKPSGVEYDLLKPSDMVVVNMQGEVIEGDLNPSSDTPTHLYLYKEYESLGGVVHTHSSCATSWAQAKSGIPCYGTTHADYYYGEIPCARNLTKEEIDEGYEKNTGKVIVECILENKKEPKSTPGILCANHGPFTWGKDVDEAVYNAIVLEEVAKMAMQARMINPALSEAPTELIEKHYQRKHGKNAYYGQKK